MPKATLKINTQHKNVVCIYLYIDNTHLIIDPSNEYNNYQI